MQHGFVCIGTVTSIRQNLFQPREFVFHGFEHLFRPYLRCHGR